jgi:heptosyltransferase-1
MKGGQTRILVVKLSSLGDLFHALPAVHTFRTRMNAEIDWVTQPEYVELVQCFTDVSRVLPYPRQRFWREGTSFRRNLRGNQYDFAVDFQGLLKSALVTVLARADRRIGPSNHREGSQFLYHEVARPRDSGRHAVHQALDICSTLDLDPPDPSFPVHFPSIPLETAHPRIALVPCSRWASKNWAPVHFIELARLLIDQFGASVYLVGGPDNQSRNVCGRIAGAVPDIHNECGNTTLPQMGGLLSAMDLAVTVDTGPMHVATATGTPVVAVFGLTDPERTGPFGPKHRVVRAPGLEGRSPVGHYRAADSTVINRIAVEDVLDQIRDVLARDRGAP